MNGDEARYQALLESMYPAYRIARTSTGWLATRYAQPTAEQRAFGIVPSMFRPDVHSLVSALSAQHGILSQRRQT
jgi:hypothetical protein